MGPRAGLDKCGKSRLTPGFDPRTVQPVASRYTDYATRPTDRGEMGVIYDLACYFVRAFLIFLTLKTTYLLAHFFLLIKNARRHAQRKQNTAVQWNLNQIRSTSGHGIGIIKVLFIRQLMHY